MDVTIAYPKGKILFLAVLGALYVAMHQKGSNGKPQQRVQTVGGVQTFLRNPSVKVRYPLICELKIY